MDDADFGGWHAVDLMQVAADKLGYGDHPFALGHHRIVFPLERIASRIGSVKRGHEWCPRPFGGETGAPGRRAGAGVNNIDAFVPDQLLKAPDVGIHDKRIFRMHRNLDVFGLDAFQFMDARPAIRGDKGAAAPGGDGPGDFHGPPLDASAGAHGRKHLKDGCRAQIGGPGMSRFRFLSSGESGIVGAFIHLSEHPLGACHGQSPRDTITG